MKPGYVKIAHVSDIPENGMKMFEVNGEEILIVNVERGFYAFHNNCPHMGYPLYFGELDGKKIRCGFHYNEFDATTGESSGPATQEPLRKYKLEIHDSAIYINI